MDSAVIERLSSLEAEGNFLRTIRSLKEDDRFRRYTAALKRRFEATINQFDVIESDEIKDLAELKGIRKTYIHEIGLIENAEKRIKEIDEEMSLINKKFNTNRGKDGAHGAIPPKETK